MNEAAAVPDVDVLIVGAGISGLGVAAHLKRRCADKSLAILEARQAIGGTWDLFRYPGVRSDSDMHTLGYAFAPWRDERAIAPGDAIRRYLERVAAEEGLSSHIRLGHKVLTAEWDGSDALWTVTIERQGKGLARLTARFVVLGSGYYDYDEPHDPPFAGREDFDGQIIHPQFWPEGFDPAGKRIVVIGSGATAATLVPALAEKAAHVTMLQRTPSWYFAQPSVDRLANALRRVLPERWAYALTRRKNIRFQDFSFRKAREQPARIGGYLKKQVRQQLGDAYDREAFSPPYGPWEQRLCLIPDGDLFTAIKAARVSMVTDGVERFDAHGVVLASGRYLPADVIVTATGLKLAVAGKIAVSVEGRPVRWNETFYYRNCLFSGVPNLAGVFGYLNAAWTLRVDIVAPYLCRLLRHMDAIGADMVVPQLPAEPLEEDDIFALFSSGYLARSARELPKSARTAPWRLNQDYLSDRKAMRKAPIADGMLRFGKAGGPFCDRGNGRSSAAKHNDDSGSLACPAL